jgi:hypothetical protein
MVEMVAAGRRIRVVDLIYTMNGLRLPTGPAPSILAGEKEGSPGFFLPRRPRPGPVFGRYRDDQRSAFFRPVRPPAGPGRSEAWGGAGAPFNIDMIVTESPWP